MKKLKVYYLENMDREYLHHGTNEIIFIEESAKYLRSEVLEIAENYKTYVLTIVEFLEEMEKLNTIRKDLEMCDNMEDLKKIANELNFKIKTKTIELD